MFLGPLRARTRALIAIAFIAASASAASGLASAGCSSATDSLFIPGLQGAPTLSIQQVGTIVVPADAGASYAIPCVAIGTDPDEQLPFLVAVGQIYLRPQGIFYPPAFADAGVLALDSEGNILDAGGTDGSCGAYSQCGHLLLYVRELGLESNTSGPADGGVSMPMDVYNNSGSSIVIPLLMRKLANREGQFLVTIKVLNDDGNPISHNGVPTPVEAQITITTSATCPISDGGMPASASSSSASGTSGTGGAGGAGGGVASASSGAGGAGGMGGSGAGGMGGSGVGGGDASTD